LALAVIAVEHCHGESLMKTCTLSFATDHFGPSQAAVPLSLSWFMSSMAKYWTLVVLVQDAVSGALQFQQLAAEIVT
jgi:hypothetical protein